MNRTDELYFAVKGKLENRLAYLEGKKQEYNPSDFNESELKKFIKTNSEIAEVKFNLTHSKSVYDYIKYNKEENYE